MKAVSIPIERIEQALEQCAVPGFYGELYLELEPLPTAALEVKLTARRKTISQKDTREDGPILPSNDRVMKVRSRMAEIADKFRLEVPIDGVRALFKDGNLISLEFHESTDLQVTPLAKPPVSIKL